MMGIVEKANIKTREVKPVKASLFFKKDAGIEGIEMNLFIEESHSLEFQLSDHPLQDGCVVTDHVFQKLRQCKIKGMFTNNPINKPKDSEGKVIVNGIEATQNTSRIKYNRLEELASKRLPVKLVTSLKTYPRMIITNIKADRGPKDGESITFSMTLREFMDVDVLEVSADYVSKPDDMASAINRLVAPKSNEGLSAATNAQSKKFVKGLGIQGGQ